LELLQPLWREDDVLRHVSLVVTLNPQWRWCSEAYPRRARSIASRDCVP
jgi:hypothetical protein